MLRWSFYPVADSYLLVSACALVLLALLWLGPARAKTTPGRRTALSAIRLAVIVLVVLEMLRPTLVYTQTERQAATLIVLGDRSRSMLVPDEVDGSTRWEALCRTLAGAKDALAELATEFEVKAYTFDAEAHPAEIVDGEIQLPDAPDGRQTAIGYVLDEVLKREKGKRLLGVVLASDGAQRAYPERDMLPQLAAGPLKLLGYPLFAVRFGKARGLGQAQDVAVKDLLANQYVFVKNEVSVTGQVRVDGYTGREIPVQLLVETSPGQMEPVDEEDLKVTADGELIPVHFTYVPQLPGEYKIAIQAVEQTGELVATNNRLSTFVNVLEGGLKVLYLEGALRPEIRFLREALDASPEIDVDYKDIDPRRPETRPNDLAERLQPGKYDVYILGDLDSSAFEGKELDDLAKTVSGGAGLMMIGGVHSFGPGGYAETALANVLPVKMDRFERQPLDEEISKDLHLSGMVKVNPTQIGLRQFPLQLGENESESRAVWAQLPPLRGANRFRTEALKPDALVLAESDQGQPLLVARRHGDGRVIAFAGDTTWRWCTHGYQSAHHRFWRQLVLWLARKDESLQGNVWVKLHQRRFGRGQRVEFTVGAEAPTGGDLKGVRYVGEIQPSAAGEADSADTAEIVRPDGSVSSVRLTSSGGVMTGSFRDTQVAGDYTIRVTALKGGETLGTAQSRFLVSDQDLELDNPAADATLLDSLAAMTRGESLLPEELPALIRRLAEDTQALEVRTETKRPLWDTWGLFLALVGLLGTEWYLRKRWGLV